MRLASCITFILACAAAQPAAADRFTLTYDSAAVGVVDLGEATFDADISEDTYEITARLSSSGLMNLFEPTEIVASASGRIDGTSGVRWERYDLDHQYSKKRRVVAMTSGQDGAITTEITPNYRLWGEPPATDEQRARSRDPLSTLMAMAVDVGATQRCAGAYPTFDGRFHYLLELAGGEIEEYEAGGYEGPVLKCSIGYIAVSGFERGDAGRRRIPRGQVWFALAEDSRFAPPVRITTPLAAGGAVIRLTQWRRPTVIIAAGDAAAP